MKRKKEKTKFSYGLQILFLRRNIYNLLLDTYEVCYATLKANLQEVIFAHCVESNLGHQYPEWNGRQLHRQLSSTWGYKMASLSH